MIASTFRKTGVRSALGTVEVQEDIMEKKNKQQQDDLPAGGQQTDLAEGELDTVEESIRIHEQKGDAQGGGPAKPKK